MNDSTSTPKKEYTARKPGYNVYKPSAKSDGGSALQFSYDSFNRAVFLQAARQKGAKLPQGAKDQYDWKGKSHIIFKIGVTDISQLLLFFSGRTKTVKCFHRQPGKDSTSVLELGQGEVYNGKPSFSFQLNRTADGSTQRVNMFLSEEEITILAHFMRESLTRMLGFSFDDNPKVKKDQ